MSLEERVRILRWLKAWHDAGNSALAQTSEMAVHLGLDVERVNDVCRIWEAEGLVLFADSSGPGSKRVAIEPLGIAFLEDATVGTEL